MLHVFTSWMKILLEKASAISQSEQKIPARHPKTTQKAITRRRRWDI